MFGKTHVENKLFVYAEQSSAFCSACAESSAAYRSMEFSPAPGYKTDQMPLKKTLGQNPTGHSLS